MDRFGRRFISDKDLLKYAADLDLFSDPPRRGILEFLERRGILNPVARIRFPGEIARSWHKQRYPNDTVPAPIESDVDRLKAAVELYHLVFNGLWSKPEVYGERIHPLDKIALKHKPFIQTTFKTASFVPWEDFRVVLAIRDGNEMSDGGTYSRICYHYWQVFALASILRSGMTILFNHENDALFEDLWNLRISDRSRAEIFGTFNLEARHELNAVMEQAPLFDAVAWFEAYRQNALQKHVGSVNRKTGRLPTRQHREYLSRERELARETLERFKLKPRQFLAFAKFQTELWCNAKRRSPAKIAKEYRRNIATTIELYRLVSRKNVDEIVARVGYVGGYDQPILKIIFPSWLDEQRGLAERSLQNWVLPSMSALPPPFTVSAPDITTFCDWLEAEGLYQLYWHFKRLLDIGLSDGPAARTAIATEVVSYANTVELMANAILNGHGHQARGFTLGKKTRLIVQPHAPQLIPLLNKFSKLTKTDRSTLRLRLAQINRIKKGGRAAPVVRGLLKLIVIRNEGSHLGLGELDREAIYELLESLVEASLILWKVK